MSRLPLASAQGCVDICWRARTQMLLQQAPRTSTESAPHSTNSDSTNPEQLLGTDQGPSSTNNEYCATGSLLSRFTITTRLRSCTMLPPDVSAQLYQRAANTTSSGVLEGCFT